MLAKKPDAIQSAWINYPKRYDHQSEMKKLSPNQARTYQTARLSNRYDSPYKTYSSFEIKKPRKNS